MAAQNFEVVDHVHLIVVAEGVRDVEPCSIGRRDLRIDGSLETCDAQRSSEMARFHA
jgi:hypothetical protein